MYRAKSPHRYPKKKSKQKNVTSATQESGCVFDTPNQKKEKVKQKSTKLNGCCKLSILPHLTTRRAVASIRHDTKEKLQWGVVKWKIYNTRRMAVWSTRIYKYKYTCMYMCIYVYMKNKMTEGCGTICNTRRMAV